MEFNYIKYDKKNKNEANELQDNLILDFINIISKYNLIYDINQINKTKLNTFIYMFIRNDYYITKEKLLNGVLE